MTNKEKISYKTFFRWAGLIAVACISGTYIFANQILSNKSDILSIQLAEYKQKFEQATSRIEVLEKNSFSASYSPAIGLVNSDSIRFKEIAEEANNLERRRNELLNQVSSHIIQSLDPKSEVISLANLLSDSNPENQKKAIRGLFEIDDERSMLVLWRYFFENEEKATSGLSPSIYEWIRMMDDFGENDGIKFCIELIKSQDEHQSRVAFEQLKEWIYEGRNISEISGELNFLAMNSEDPLVRTRAKLLLNTSEKVEKQDEYKDTRSLFRVLYDIEGKVDTLLHKKEYR